MYVFFIAVVLLPEKTIKLGHVNFYTHDDSDGGDGGGRNDCTL